MTPWNLCSASHTRGNSSPSSSPDKELPFLDQASIDFYGAKWLIEFYKVIKKLIFAYLVDNSATIYNGTKAKLIL